MLEVNETSLYWKISFFIRPHLNEKPVFSKISILKISVYIRGTRPNRRKNICFQSKTDTCGRDLRLAIIDFMIITVYNDHFLLYQRTVINTFKFALTKNRLSSTVKPPKHVSTAQYTTADEKRFVLFSFVSFFCSEDFSQVVEVIPKIQH